MSTLLPGVKDEDVRWQAYSRFGRVTLRLLIFVGFWSLMAQAFIGTKWFPGPLIWPEVALGGLWSALTSFIAIKIQKETFTGDEGAS